MSQEGKMDSPWIDFHTHSQICGEQEIEVVSIDVNKWKEASFYTLGFHPWWTNGKLTEIEINFISEKYSNDPRCLGIGECGLDLLKGVHLDRQEEIFLQQVELANKLRAPVIVHCVRAYDRIIRLKRNFAKTDWVIHGYIRNAKLARQLLDAGFFLSTAPYHGMKQTFIDTLSYIPMNKIFLETDSDFSLSIYDRYRIFAQLRNLEMDELKESINNNFKQFFKDKWQHHTG